MKMYLKKFVIYFFQKSLRYNSIFLTIRWLPISEERFVFSFTTEQIIRQSSVKDHQDSTFHMWIYFIYECFHHLVNG